jgi:hypothetical protein
VQAENNMANLENDSKILKRGIQVQQQKCAKLEEEVAHLRAFTNRALEHINKLEQVCVCFVCYVICHAFLAQFCVRSFNELKPAAYCCGEMHRDATPRLRG